MRSQRAWMIAAGAVLVVLAVLLTVLLVTDRPRPAPTAVTGTTAPTDTPTTATTAAATTSGTAATTGSTALAATSTTTGTTGLARVSAAGALLAAPREPFNVDGSAALPCTAFVDNGHVLGPSRCGRVRLAPTGGLAIWVTGRTPDARAWTVRIFAYDGRGSWSERLRAVEQAPGQTWTGVDVVAATLSPGAAR